MTQPPQDSISPCEDRMILRPALRRVLWRLSVIKMHTKPLTNNYQYTTWAWPSFSPSRGRLRVMPAFQIEDCGRCLTSWFSHQTIHWWLKSTYGSPLPFSPLLSAWQCLLPFWMTVVGLLSTTDKVVAPNKKTKPTCFFFFLPPYKLFLNICGHDSSKSTSTQLLPDYRNPFPCGCPPR